MSFALLLLALLAPPPVPAIVLERHPGPRAARAAEAVAPLVAEVGRLARAEHGRALAERIEAAVGPRVVALDAAARDALRRQVGLGVDAYLDGRLAEAVRTLGEAHGRFASLAAGTAGDAALRALLLKAEVALALAHERGGQRPRRDELAAFAARQLPDQEVARRELGPEAVELLSAARRQVAAGARGNLRVESSPPGLPVLLSGRVVGRTPALLPGLPAGEYWVEVPPPAGRGRLRRVVVGPGETRVRASPEADASIRSDGWVGVAAGGPERAARLAAELGAQVAAARVYLVGVDARGGREVLRVDRVAVASGAIERTAEHALGPDPPGLEDIGRLAREVTSELPPAPAAAGHEGRPAWWRDATGWALAGGGLAVLGFGGWAVAEARNLRAEERGLSVSERRQRDERADTYAALGYGSLAGGAVLAALGVIKLVLVPGPRDAPARAGVRLDLFLADPGPGLARPLLFSVHARY